MDPDQGEQESYDLSLEQIEDTFDEDEWPPIVDLYRDLDDTFPGGPS